MITDASFDEVYIMIITHIATSLFWLDRDFLTNRANVLMLTDIKCRFLLL